MSQTTLDCKSKTPATSMKTTEPRSAEWLESLWLEIRDVIILIGEAMRKAQGWGGEIDRVLECWGSGEEMPGRVDSAGAEYVPSVGPEISVPWSYVARQLAGDGTWLAEYEAELLAEKKAAREKRSAERALEEAEKVKRRERKDRAEFERLLAKYGDRTGAGSPSRLDSESAGS